MEKEEILKGNKMISEFMGCPEKGFKYIENDCKFHSSWDWLMPVVEKINSIDISPAPNWRGYRTEIVPRGYVKIEGFPMPTITTNVSIEGSLIAAIFKAVILFIEWYNQQSLTPTIQ